VRRRERELGEQIVPPGLLAVHIAERVEALDLAGEADGELLGIELGDRGGAGRAGQ